MIDTDEEGSAGSASCIDSEAAGKHTRKLAYMKEYNARVSKEKITYNKQWYQDHKEHAKAAARKYRQDHPEETTAANARWRAANQDHVRAYSAAYQAANQPRQSKKARDKRLAFFAADPKAAWIFYTFNAAQGRARKRGLPYDLDPAGIQLPDLCPVLGLALKYSERRKKPSADSPSLDRVVPSSGYVTSNLRVISWRANVLKRDASIDEVRRVLAYMENCLSKES